MSGESSAQMPCLYICVSMRQFYVLIHFVYLQTLRTCARVMVIKSFCHAIKVRGRRKKDKHVEYLVGAAPDVKGSGIDSLWPTSL
jgi:hypothetical protein